MVQRLTKILARYELSWIDVDKAEGEPMWEHLIRDSIDADIHKLLTQKADHYQLSTLSPKDPNGRVRKPAFSITQKMPLYLQTMGDLPRAALRARYFRLRYVLGRGNTSRGQCRLCQKGDENSAHLTECPNLPRAFILRREELYKAIAAEAGHRRTQSRVNQDRIHSYLSRISWPKAKKPLVKKVLAFHRNLINMYAAVAPPAWEEGATTQAIIIRRVRSLRPSVSPSSAS